MITKTANILEHLKTYGSITSLEAIYKYNATRLAVHIHALRKRGWIITSVREQTVKATRYARYVLEGRKEE